MIVSIIKFIITFGLLGTTLVLIWKYRYPRFRMLIGTLIIIALICMIPAESWIQYDTSLQAFRDFHPKDEILFVFEEQNEIDVYCYRIDKSTISYKAVVRNNADKWIFRTQTNFDLFKTYILDNGISCSTYTIYEYEKMLVIVDKFHSVEDDFDITVTDSLGSQFSPCWFDAGGTENHHYVMSGYYSFIDLNVVEGYSVVVDGKAFVLE